MSAGIIASLLPATDAILSVRDSIGANRQPVYLLTRTWYTDAGHTTPSSDISGYAKDVSVKLLPSPQIIDWKQDLRAREAGVVRNGDVNLKGISLNKYTESQLDGTSSANNVENLYMIGVKVYQVVKISQDYVTWNVVLKELTNQTRY